MSLFEIDEKLCKRDGICVAVCPVGIIEMKSKDSTPSPIEAAYDLCLGCGHCVAVCPHGAMSLRTMQSSDCPPIQTDLLPRIEQVEHFLRHRRSIRNYNDKPVDRDTLEMLIKVASYAPSGHNLQPVNWLVIQEARAVRHLAELVSDWMRIVIEKSPDVAAALHLDRVISAWDNGTDRILRGAPHLVVAHAPNSIPPAQAACTIALTYLELAASAMGLGACWAGYFHSAAGTYGPLIETLALPNGHQCFGAMMLGYKKYQYKRLPLRKIPTISWR